MSYAITDIITWAKCSQALAAIGEASSKANQQGTIEEDLHVKLYVERKSLEYAYAQNPTSDQTFQIGQGVLALCGMYLFEAQQASGNGGSITPIYPTDIPDPLEFIVNSSSPIISGASTFTTTQTQFSGYNLLVVWNNVTQSTINRGGTYFSWDRNTAIFSLGGSVAQSGDLIQIYPFI